MEAYQPLYLRHRPQTLKQLVGQRSVVKTLSNAIENDRIAHAYLFTGPRGTGKTSSARILAKSLNCQEGPTTEPCMVCPMCTEIKQGISPAVLEIDAASNNSVDDARILIERAPLVAQGGRFKLYIIDECHMLTKEAFNALLKTIEEPPPRVIFVLATTEEHKVPPTIISRCQRLMFRLVSHEDLIVHLRNVADQEEINIEDSALELIARRSGGGLRDAMGLLDQASLLATAERPVSVTDLLTLLGAIDEDVLLEISKGMKERNGEQVLTAVHGLLSHGREPSLVALELSKHFLNMTKALHLGRSKERSDKESILPQIISGSSGYIKAITELAPSFEGYELTQMVEHLDRLEQSLRRSTQPALSLEIGLLSLCYRQEIHLIKDLVGRIEALEAQLADGPRLQAPRPQSQLPPPQANTHAPAAYEAQRPPLVKETVKEPVREPEREKEAEPDRAPQFVPDNRVPERTAGQPEREVRPSPQADPPPKTPAVAAPPQNAQGTKPTTEKSTNEEGSYPFEVVNEFWSNLLEELHSRSIPTYSLVSQFGFPLALRDDELVISVSREHFQKTIENKADQIKSAAKKITGRDLFIKVKIQTEQPNQGKIGRSESKNEAESQSQTGPSGQARESQPAPREYASPPSEAHGDGDSAGDEDDESDPPPQDMPGRTRPDPFELENQEAPTPGERVDRVEKVEGVATLSSERPRRVNNVPPPETGDQLMVKEAYKLFEGPGSRQIG
ncbi:MAG: DNA polymerase III subunit gamma/tau [Candidatus Obscuribacterales bacterium]|nr:DNA polymerase III subunit gamma/tau [Candidatus Obscuribacterales bacterium]